MKDVEKKSEKSPTPEPVACMERLRDAINAHSVDAMADCFDLDYQSTFPLHPDRAFGGRDQMRKNWTQILAGVPDMHATLVRSCSDGDVVWVEWDWQGTHPDGEPYHFRGVTIQSVQDGRIVWVRLYMEPVQEAGPGTDAAVRSSLAGSAENVNGGER